MTFDCIEYYTWYDWHFIPAYIINSFFESHSVFSWYNIFNIMLKRAQQIKTYKDVQM